MGKILAQTADRWYIVETKSRWRRRREREEMPESDIDWNLIYQWRQWWDTEKDPESINKERVEEYWNQQVAKAFSSSLASSKPPVGWIDVMTSFVQESDPAEDLWSLIRRFGERFPRMRGCVSSVWFESIRGDVGAVSSSDDDLW